MKTLVLAALLAGTATTAMAADLPTRKAPMAPAPLYTAPAFTWTGFYIGVNGGVGYGYGTNTAFSNPFGGLIGGTVGYNYQFGQFVLGAEADLDWARISSTNNIGNVSNSFKVNALTTERLRLGYAVDRALFYVTGGYAGASTHATISNNTGYAASQDYWRSGGVIGGGIEYAFTNNITAKAEYLWAPLSSKTYWANTPYVEGGRETLSIARAGINFKF